MRDEKVTMRDLKGDRLVVLRLQPHWKNRGWKRSTIEYCIFYTIDAATW